MGSYNGLLSRGTTGLESHQQSVRALILRSMGLMGRDPIGTDQSKYRHEGPTPSVDVGTERWFSRSPVPKRQRCLTCWCPPSDLKDFILVTASVQKVAAMPTSTLRDFLEISFFGSNLGRCIKWALVAVCLTFSITQAKAEYRVNIGDVLEVAVAGVPDLRQRAAVQVDGNISLPLVGALPVAGLPLSQIRAKSGLRSPARCSPEGFGWP